MAVSKIPEIGESVEVQKSRDYQKFKFPSWNRSVSKSRAKKIANSPRTLKYSPIVVQPDNQGNLVILDGQHRYEACKIAGVPVHYIIDHDTLITPEMVSQQNAQQKSWRHIDHINFYCDHGVPSFLFIKDLLSRYDLKVGHLRSLAGIALLITTGRIKDGSLEVYESDRAEEFLSYYRSIREAAPHYTNVKFCRALSKVYSSPDIDNERLKDRLISYPNKASSRMRHEEQVSTIVDAYNYRTPTDEKVGAFEVQRGAESLYERRRDQWANQEPEYPGAPA